MTTHIQREAINPPGMWSSRPSSPASAAIKVGNLVFISGQVALDQDGRVVGKDDIRAQSQHVFQALKTILEEAGCGMDGLVKITTFLTDSAHYAAENEIRNRHMPQPPPASTTQVVRKIALDPDLLIAVEGIAVV
jgi:enamine deaminase RidA (YjgF/YER057c/UK114 family)